MRAGRFGSFGAGAILFRWPSDAAPCEVQGQTGNWLHWRVRQASGMGWLPRRVHIPEVSGISFSTVLRDAPVSVTHRNGLEEAFTPAETIPLLPGVLQGDQGLRRLLGAYQSAYMDLNRQITAFPDRLNPLSPEVLPELARWLGASRWLRRGLGYRCCVLTCHVLWINTLANKPTKYCCLPMFKPTEAKTEASVIKL